MPSSPAMTSAISSSSVMAQACVVRPSLQPLIIDGWRMAMAGAISRRIAASSNAPAFRAHSAMSTCG
ncbi:hypothetical protein D3C80_2140220 [compost metagenome]